MRHHKTKKLSIGVIGAGNRGTAYGRALISREKQDVEVIAIAEPDKIRQDKFSKLSKRYNEITIFSDWRDLLKACQNGEIHLDGVLICVQDKMHAEVAVEFADLKIHMLVEKPLAVTIDECKSIVNAAINNNIILGIGHVLRYSPHNTLLKSLIDSDMIGDIININHTEPIGHTHFAHSYVRGNWRREDESCFSLMTKCCHDIDLIIWLANVKGSNKCLRVSSFGTLNMFQRENKPLKSGNATRCLDCNLKDECAFSAKRTYLDPFRNGLRGWPVNVVSDIEDEDTFIDVLHNGNYGKCVFALDNNVNDNQIVNFQFETTTATLTMIAQTEQQCQRFTRIYGTKGELESDCSKGIIKIFDFASGKSTNFQPSSDDLKLQALSGHGGGDFGLAWAFIDAVVAAIQTGDTVEAQKKYLLCTPEEILFSHMMVFEAERARRTSSVVKVDDVLS